MKPIKFRAWAKSHKSMSPPATVDDMVMTCIEYSDASLYFVRSLQTGDTVLMQYTGLKDKNGVEIYECDIVNTHPDEESNLWLEVINWDEENSGFNPFHNVGDGWGQIQAQKVEVIGNIYENPELLND